MSISFDAAIGNLKSMFPEWDEETISTLLVANNYHVERTIETILTMCGDTSITPPPAPEPVAPAPYAPRPTAAPSSPPQSRSTSRDHYGSSAGAQPYAAPSSADRRYRGVKQDLPDDFLRPPGFQSNIIADEELALMLQNELFQKEARAMLGDDFLAAGAYGGARDGREPARRPSRGPAESPAAPAQGSGSDMGFVKALSSMGSATKKSLSQLAQRFSAAGGAQGGAGGAGAVRRSSRTGETGTSREFKPLVESNHLDDEEEEETEVISFDSKGSRSQHVLQGRGRGFEEQDAQNPLIAQQLGKKTV